MNTYCHERIPKHDEEHLERYNHQKTGLSYATYVLQQPEATLHRSVGYVGHIRRESHNTFCRLRAAHHEEQTLLAKMSRSLPNLRSTYNIYAPQGNHLH